MVKEACLLCKQRVPRDKCYIIVLTSREREQIRKQGEDDLDEYIYCMPCWKVLSDPVKGPAVMRGLLERRLRMFGVPNSEALANRYHDELIKRALKPRS